MTAHSEDIVVKEIFIECRPETLFSYFTDPEKMACWMGRRALLEPKLGGQFHVEFNSGHAAKGKYVELIPNRKIVFTWGWTHMADLPPGSSTVEFRLHEQDGGTLLVLTHSGLSAAKMRTHSAGWLYYTSRLQTVALGRDPGPDTFS